MAELSARVQEKGQVTIPRKIRQRLNLKPGDLVTFVVTDSGVVIKPLEVVPADELRQNLANVVRSIRENFKEYSADEVDSLVDQAIRETRKNQG